MEKIRKVWNNKRQILLADKGYGAATGLSNDVPFETARRIMEGEYGAAFDRRESLIT